MSRARPLELFLGLGAAALALAAAAWTLVEGPPLQHPGPTTALFDALDLDGNGVLAGDELRGREPPGLPWTAHDLDGSGGLDARELEILMTEGDPRWLLRQPG